MKKSAAVAIVAALPVEKNALLKRVSSPEMLYDNGTLEYYVCSCLLPGTRSPIKILIVDLQKAGNVYAAAAVKTLLSSWEPSVVVSFGIAGGVTSEDPGKLDRIEHGDVIFGDYVFYYEHATEDRSFSREAKLNFPSIKCDLVFAADARKFFEAPVRGQERHWQKEINIAPPSPLSPGHPKLLVGAIASGEKVIRSSKAMSRLRALQHHCKIRAFEMEAFGVGAASTEYLTEPYRFMVVKGVADYAREDKSDDWHEYAAESAAAFLFDFLAMAARNENKNGTPFQSKRASFSIPRDLSERAEAVKLSLPPYFVSRLDLAELRRVLTERSVDVFYHWRALHQHVHWVDFCFILVLRKLAMLGHRVNLVVTDRIHTKPFADVKSPEDLSIAKQSTQILVNAILGERACLWWISDIEAKLEQIDEYARSEGIDQSVERAIDNIQHFFGRSEGNDVVKSWLKFVGWQVRDHGRCIILEWKRHASMWRQIFNFVNVSPAIIETEDFKLGSRLGKLEMPGKDLVVTPPEFKEIMQWTLKERSDVRLRNFLQYILLQEVDVRSLVKRYRDTGVLTRENIAPLWEGQKVRSILEKKRLSTVEACRLGIVGCLIDFNRSLFL